jgi:hypothetical protein
MRGMPAGRGLLHQLQAAPLLQPGLLGVLYAVAAAHNA